MIPIMINPPPGTITAVVLGIMQDGGLPHIGCRCPNCLAARERPEYVTCLGIVDRRGQDTAVYLIDATPDIKYQLDLLADSLGPHRERSYRLRQPDAIFLTHAHMGHIGGLPQLGPEAMAVEKLSIYAAPKLNTLLQEARIWSPLMENLVFHLLTAGEPVRLAPDLYLTPVPVPHRDEWGVGTFAFHIQGPEKSLLYLPDIDAWELWEERGAWLTAVDYALVDASFWSADELGDRLPVAHPLVPHTMGLLADKPGQLILTHLNHTNPLLSAQSAERALLSASGVQIAQTGQMLLL